MHCSHAFSNVLYTFAFVWNSVHLRNAANISEWPSDKRSLTTWLIAAPQTALTHDEVSTSAPQCARFLGHSHVLHFHLVPKVRAFVQRGMACTKRILHHDPCCRCFCWLIARLSWCQARLPCFCLWVIVRVTYINGGLGVLQDTIVQNKKSLQRK